MTKKRQALKLGKEIRKTTGVKLPIAMRVAKLLVRGRSMDVPKEWLTSFNFFCGIDCCGPAGYKLVGPKGEFKIIGY